MTTVNQFPTINNCNEKNPAENADWNATDLPNQRKQYDAYKFKCNTQQIIGCSEKFPPVDESQWNTKTMMQKKNLYDEYKTKCELNEKYDTLRDLQSKSCTQKYQQHNSKFLLIGLLIEIYRKNDLPDIDNYYRSLLHALHEYKLIDFGVECSKTVQIIGNSKQLGKESMSITVQWLDIQPNSLTDFLKITVNKKKCDELLDNFFSYFGFNFDTSVPFKRDFEENEPRTKVAALYTKFSDLVLKTIEKLKKNFFLKLGPTTLIESQEQLKSEREVYFYKLLTNYVFNHNTPHIATHIYSNECLNFADIQGLQITTDKGQVPIKEFFSKAMQNRQDLDGFILLMTENMAPSIPLTNFVSSFYETDMTQTNSQEHVKDMKQIIFQVFYTLYIFYGMNFVHNDLHLGNIMIETLGKEFDYYYIIGDQTNAYKVVQLKTKYFVRIYDFDLSYILFDSQYDNYMRNVDKLQGNLTKRLGEKNEDFDFFMKRLAKLYQNPSESDNKKLFDTYKTKNLLSDQNKLTIRDSTYKEINGFIKNYDLSKKSMFMILKWMDVLPDNDQSFKVYSSLKDIPLTNESKIFFPQTIDINKFGLEMDGNAQWKNKSIFEKIIICHPFVQKNESANIQKEFKSLTLQGGNRDYYYKYMKYKHKCNEVMKKMNS